MTRPKYIVDFYSRIDSLAKDLKKPSLRRKVPEMTSKETELMTSDKRSDNSMKIASKFSGKVFDGLRDEDREKTDYNDDSRPTQ